MKLKISLFTGLLFIPFFIFSQITNESIKLKIQEKAKEKYQPSLSWWQLTLASFGYERQKDINLFYVENGLGFSLYKRFGISIIPKIYTNKISFKPDEDANLDTAKYTYYSIPLNFIIPIFHKVGNKLPARHSEYKKHFIDYKFRYQHYYDFPSMPAHHNLYLKLSYNIYDKLNVFNILPTDEEELNYSTGKYETVNEKKRTYTSSSFFSGAYSIGLVYGFSNMISMEVGFLNNPSYIKTIFNPQTFYFKLSFGIITSTLIITKPFKHIINKTELKKERWVAKELEKRSFKRGLPPNLYADLDFRDDNQNGILEAKENSELIIKLTNKGEGNAQGVHIEVTSDQMDNQLTIGSADIHTLKANKSKEIKIPIKAGLNIQTAKHKLKIKVTEFYGYDMDPAYLYFNTFKYQEPKIVFSGLEIKDDGIGTSPLVKDGLIQAGEMVKIKIIIQNVGQGIAENVLYNVRTSDKNIYLDNNTGNLKKMYPGEIKEIWVNISPNKRITTCEQLPIFLTVNEKIGHGNLPSYQLPLILNTEPPKVEILEVKSDFASLKKDIAKFEYSSKRFKSKSINIEDINLVEKSKTKRKKSVGIVFGIENYKYFPPAPYAVNDANTMKEYFEKKLGVEQVIIYTNDEVSGFLFDDIFNADNGELSKTIVEGETEVFIYYSGHGIPDKEGKNVYLFPSDGKLNRLEQQGYSINKLYENLNKLGAKNVMLILDACFTGVSKTSQIYETNNLVAQKGFEIVLKKPWLNNPNFFVITSSSSNETSLAFDKVQHGLLTYYLCSGLNGSADLDGNRKVSFSELEQYVKENVIKTSKIIRAKQTPEFYGNSNYILLKN